MVPIWPFVVFKLNKINNLLEVYGAPTRTRTYNNINNLLYIKLLYFNALCFY